MNIRCTHPLNILTTDPTVTRLMVTALHQKQDLERLAEVLFSFERMRLSPYREVKLCIFGKPQCTMTTYISDRIAINPDICNGRPIIRGMRITVQTILEFLYAGTPREEILYQYPMLEPEDLDACQRFAIELMERQYVIQEIKKVA